MPLESPPKVAERVSDLNRRFHHQSAFSVLEHALSDPLMGRAALVSSFGTESVALLHMVSVLDRTTPVLFLDTGIQAPETLPFGREICERLQLGDVRTLRPDREQVFLRDPDGILHLFDPTACSMLRKTEPLRAALRSFDAWITGRKRYRRSANEDLRHFESDGGRRIKVNPLAYWSHNDVREYIEANALHRHPLATVGYSPTLNSPDQDTVESEQGECAGYPRRLTKVEHGVQSDSGPDQAA